MTIGINGTAHFIATVSRFELAHDFSVPAIMSTEACAGHDSSGSMEADHEAAGAYLSRSDKWRELRALAST